jgi:hypothetical protein
VITPGPEDVLPPGYLGRMLPCIMTMLTRRCNNLASYCRFRGQGAGAATVEADPARGI